MDVLNLDLRIRLLERLGVLLDRQDFQEPADSVQDQNPWFNPENLKLACKAWAYALQPDKINQWIRLYADIPEDPPLIPVQIVMAGNLPLVGLHDLLCVLVSGHKALVKLSSKDSILIPWLFRQLHKDFPGLENHISFVNSNSSAVKAALASGSNITKTHFSDIYRGIPKVLRGERHSLAYLDGKESLSDFELLKTDLLSYYGLGCRNVSLLFVPNKSILESFIAFLETNPPSHLPQAYKNTLRQQRAVLQLTKDEYLDCKYLLFVEKQTLASPMGVIHYSLYKSYRDLDNFINLHQNDIQCVVAKPHGHLPAIPFGKAQYPELWDYADGVDTLQFLNELNP